MTMRYDEVGYWTEIKLEIVSKYAAAYSRISMLNLAWITTT